jgi:hypothetical protein
MSLTSSAVLLSSTSDRSTSSGGQSTVLLVQWALALACTYMVLFSEQSRGLAGWGSLIILVFLVMNVTIGRLDVVMTQTRPFVIGIGLADAVLIVGSLQTAGQLSIELVMLCLGIVILAIAGLRLATIAFAAMAMMLIYTLIVAFTGNETAMRSGTLLRFPFLFIAAVVYAWFVELGSSSPKGLSGAAADLASQKQAIERCRQALGSGAMSAAESALAEIEHKAQALERTLARA